MITVQREIILPKGTSSSSPIREEIPVARAIVRRISVVFPPGSAGYMGVRLRHGGAQIVPASFGAWLSGDDITYPYEVEVDLRGTDGKLTFEGYNEDIMYDHMVLFIFECDYEAETIEERIYTVVANALDTKLSDVFLKLEEVRLLMEGLLSQMGEMTKEIYKLRSFMEEEATQRRYRELPLEELFKI